MHGMQTAAEDISEENFMHRQFHRGECSRLHRPWQLNVATQEAGPAEHLFCMVRCEWTIRTDRQFQNQWTAIVRQVIYINGVVLHTTTIPHKI